MFGSDIKKTKKGPITGWSPNDFVRLRDGMHATPIGQIYLEVDDIGVSNLGHLERVQDGIEIWTVYGPRGPVCAGHPSLETCHGPVSPLDRKFFAL